MTSPIRCLVVDDKPLALDILTDYIGKVPFLHLVAATTNPLDALMRIADEPIDLVFLDIQMPELTGLQFLTALNSRSRVILTTAYAEYALDGFEHDVVDYLLKPISFERFYRAVLKVQQQMRPSLDLSPEPRAYLFIRTEHRMQRVNIADILYAEGLQNYTIVHTVTEKVIARQTFSSLETSLPPSAFVRVHKSFIVALAHISTVERSRIYINNGNREPVNIPIGDAYRDRFYKLLGT
ncbi:LytR/AlgR family response regulator transcription factor [Spirosoma pollinicola]|uniref:DNA-binding response regulator n=1 Tax=Spirosoma pollinicola TaxID=2057025 RepID=A0A2K8Z3C1_9BACT|nr:LytTR family DNA-binding domain-containing protein [Spirosoma pollinicola]AUD04341.1 DNA-binding response regulator [Spirosoma pollinicola]